jgi:hypothetical protein
MGQSAYQVTTRRTLGAFCVSLARYLHPIAAATIVVLVCVQVYLIADFIFGAPNALHWHTTLGKVVVGFELIVFVTALVGYWHDKREIRLSSALLVIGALQASFAQDIGNSPEVHALHGLLALFVLVLAWTIAARTRSVLTARRPSQLS